MRATRALISQAEFARRMGVTKQGVNEAVKAGRISLTRGKIDEPAARRDWERNTDASSPDSVLNRPRARKTKRGPSVSSVSPTGSYSAHRADREESLAELAKIELGRKRGELVPAAEVERRAFDQARLARNALLAIPPRLCAVLAGITDPADIERRLKVELEAVCAQLAKGGTKP